MDEKLVEEPNSESKGKSYFFVTARSSGAENEEEARKTEEA